MPVNNLLNAGIKTWLQKSIHSELYASNLYKHIANHLQRLGFFGSQEYFLKESKAELHHYQKLVDYLNDMGSVADIPSIEGFTIPITSISDALNKAYNTELELMKQYQDFYREAEEEYEDCVTSQFLLKFLKIQRKSVGEYADLISRYEKSKDDVLEFDEEMKKLAS